MRPPTSLISPGFPAQLSGILAYGLRRPRLPGKEGGLLHFSAVGKPVRAASTIYSAPIERVGSCADKAPETAVRRGSKRAIIGPNPKLDPPGGGGKAVPPFIAPLSRAYWNTTRMYRLVDSLVEGGKNYGDINWQAGS